MIGWTRTAVGGRSRGAAEAGLAVALAAVAGCTEEGASFAGGEELVERAVVELWDDPAAVYDRAAPALQSGVSRRAFREEAEDLASVLGAFEGVDRIGDAETATSPRGDTLRVRAELSFERADVTADFSFQERGGDALLLGVEIPVPAELELGWKAAGAARGTQRAPEEAREAARAALSALAGAEADSGALASDAAAEEMAALEDELGAYREPVRFSWSRLEPEGERAALRALLAFDDEWAEVEATLVRSESGERAWRLEELRRIGSRR